MKLCKNVLLILALASMSSNLYAQQKEYIGAGNHQNVTVTSSSDHQLYTGAYTASAKKTVDGSGLVGPRMDAARFLSQATFGGSQRDVDYIVEKGIDAWLDEQFLMPVTFLTDSVQSTYEQAKLNYVANGNNINNYTGRPDWRHVDYSWWTNTMLAKDQLRQRMAYALSQTLVISSQGTLSSYGLAVSNYYDLLIEHSFANFQNLLYQVTLSVAMGTYLSHLNNPKADLSKNLHPDENYAREIMQLFSIGLHKLNIDGSLKLDANGKAIPTYDNDDIKELAKVFTGLGVGKRTDGRSLYFYLGIFSADFGHPMIMYEDHHDKSQKTILDAHVIPAGQNGMTDIFNAVNHLYNHPNVGPFISRQLIQHLVKSNPSPAYIQHVAQTFNDNGSGVRGDLKSVLKAILTYPEARTCSPMQDQFHGKLREPALRFSHFARFFGGATPHNGRYWNYGTFFRDRVAQHPLHSPTVFNFFGPEYTPNGPIADAGFVAPEFEIHNTNTSVGYADMVYYWVESELLFISYSSDAIGRNNVTTTNLSSLTELAKDEDALLDHFNLYFCNGQLSERTRRVIKTKLQEFPGTSLTNIERRIRLATYMIMISPDYVVAR